MEFYRHLPFLSNRKTNETETFALHIINIVMFFNEHIDSNIGITAYYEHFLTLFHEEAINQQINLYKLKQNNPGRPGIMPVRDAVIKPFQELILVLSGHYH